jgi:hypothetical protein
MHLAVENADRKGPCAAGMGDGAGAGENTRSAVIARALNDRSMRVR